MGNSPSLRHGSDRGLPKKIGRRFVWSSKVPTKMSQFGWRIMNNGLPVDSSVKKVGVRLASRCYVCQKGFEEDPLVH